MTTRRRFIKQSGLVTLGGLVSPRISFDKYLEDYREYPGLQLYSIRGAMDIAPKKSLHKISNIGYKAVESASYSGSGNFYGLSPKEFAKTIADTDLEHLSSHYDLGIDNPDKIGTVVNAWERAVEDAYITNLKYMVCAWYTQNDGLTLDYYKKVSEELNKAGEICKKAGIQFCYHNHHYEFKKIDGTTPYDLLLRRTDEDLVKMEMDMFWITQAGYTAQEYINKYPKRFPLWHVKDRKRLDSGYSTDPKSGVEFITEVGQGGINWVEVFKLARESGMKYFFVEQDYTPGNPFISIENALMYLQRDILG